MKTKLNRRNFLKSAAKAGLFLAAAPMVVPARVLGRGGYVAPSERIVMGGLGVGNRGRSVLDWMMGEKDIQFVADCDLQKNRRELVKKMVDARYGNTDCKLYSDMHEFLATRPDIDALLVATGDRWHATAAIHVMRAGKDIYCEKPSSMTIAEGRAVVETAKRYGRVYQTGTQRLSMAPFVAAQELAESGRLGKIHTLRAHIAPWDAAKMRTDWLPEEPLPPKDECNWDMWLGPCPWRPYNKAYVGGAWRGHYDFHTSCIGEWGAHTFAQCQAGIGLTHTAAVKYNYVDNESGDGMVTEFANGMKMVLQRKGWHGSCGNTFEGTEGWAGCADGYSKPEVSSPALLADYQKIVEGYQQRTGRSLSHVRDFFDCVKSRRQTVANPEVMHYSMSTVHAANICMWLGRDLKYDPVKEQFIGDAEANRYLSRAHREPWTI